MDFHTYVTSGIRNIYQNDFRSQEHYLSVICNDLRGIAVDAIYHFDGVFIPNEGYVDLYFGPESHKQEFGMYNSFGQVLWQNSIIFPVYDVNNKVAGLVGYNPIRQIEAQETNNYLINHYSYSLKRVFKKGDYLFCKKGNFMEAYRKGYLVLVDGVFDMISLTEAGFVSAAMLGSTLTDAVAAQLRFIDKIIVAADNDDAGLELFDKIRKVHKGAVLLRQGVAKDADDVLKSKYRNEYLELLRECVNSKIPLSFNLGIQKLSAF